MTYRELRDFLNTLTDEQLDQTAQVIGVDTPGGAITQAEVLDEDWVMDGEGACPRSVWDESLTDEEKAGSDPPELIWPKGSVHIVFEVNP